MATRERWEATSMAEKEVTETEEIEEVKVGLEADGKGDDEDE